MRYLITGGAGFIGSNIAATLVERGETVRIIDNFSTGFRSNIQDMLPRIELIEGDIRSYHLVREAVEGMDAILHQAALPSVPRSVKDPLTSNDVNITGTLNVLYAAKDAHVKRVVYASSSSVYGDTPELPKHERMTPRPLSPYAVSKLAAEQYCQVFARNYGLETVALRYFNVFGPRQNPDSQYAAVIPRFIRMMMRGESPTVFGDGEQSRDFTFVQNTVDANLRAAVADCPPGTVVNCACNERTTLNTLVQRINGLLGTNVQPVYEAPRAGDILHSLGAIIMAEQLIGYRPGVSFEEGLRSTVEWYRGNAH